jgi:acid phosphatase family membrane protein YuiD
MDNVFSEIFRNKIFMTTVSAWLITQTIKVTLGVLRERRFDFRWFIGTGGMPSSHSAGASCLATAVGLEQGFTSTYFALAAAFALVVMFDAQVVRYSSGRQAHVLNQIMEDIYWKGRIHEGRLRELIGHTPLQVIAGMILGILIALMAYK